MLPILQAQAAEEWISRRDRNQAAAEARVRPILDEVRQRGDAALREYAMRFDGYCGPFEIPIEPPAIADDLAEAIETARRNIEEFARAQMPQPFFREFSPGRWLGQEIRPLDRVAAYVPGGRYPMPSSVLMAAVPAKVAGVPEVWVTTPRPIPETLAAARAAGVNRLAQLGGAHAIAAFAFGTETIPRVDRIVGPGNLFVATAKKLLAGEVGIDFVAGPTEVVIVADGGEPAWIAADILAQAEHDTDASAVFITTSRAFAEQVNTAVQARLQTLPTARVAEAALRQNSAILLTESRAQAADWVNRVAPEHLCLHDESLLPEIRHAGGIFLGPHSAEAFGDYASGPNHVLPTAGTARIRGGLSVLDFLKIITIQRLEPQGLPALIPVVAALARAEGLEGHARSIEVRG